MDAGLSLLSVSPGVVRTVDSTLSANPSSRVVPHPASGLGWRGCCLVGLIVACGYLPMLSAPFDFIDDGNLVYPHRESLSATGHVGMWWSRVVANVEHLGPFRPVLWAHWELQAECFQGEAWVWRLYRLLWAGLAGALLAGWLSAFSHNRYAVALITLAACWNPYRNEIWTSLTLAEGVAMPYAMLALIAAMRGGRAASARQGWQRTLPWDLLAAGMLLLALGCKNTYVALLPAMVWCRANGGSAISWGRFPQGGELVWWLIYALPVLMPALHFAYFQRHWQPGHYETPGPSVGQLLRILDWMRGASGADFFGLAGLLLPAWLWRSRHRQHSSPGLPGRVPVVAALLLAGAGIAVYSVTNIMAARYTMPAIWGVDLLGLLLLTNILNAPKSACRRWVLLAIGLGLLTLTVANWGRQEKVMARNQVLWQLLRHVEANAPPGATIDWQSGPVKAGYLDAEEGIHWAWHLEHRLRTDLKVRLLSPQQTPLQRVELPEAGSSPAWATVRAVRAVEPPQGWRFQVRYRFGLRQVTLELVPRWSPPPGTDADLFRALTGHSLEVRQPAQP